MATEVAFWIAFRACFSEDCVVDTASVASLSDDAWICVYACKRGEFIALIQV